tara:strand:+ start:5460 stop:5597 length:138 start_codon:yes stop_codon:yes gene_type:complete
MEEQAENKISESKDTKNWKAWYWGLMIFLAVQIAIYLFITNLYTI